MASKDSKAPRPRAETPRGFRDHFGAEVTARQAMLETVAEVYHRYGFEALESPAVETVEALGKFLPDVDRPNDGVFAWHDAAEGWLALRYDLTAPLARVYAQHRQSLPTPYRRYAMGPVWRNEKPGPGRFRQFYQCDADTVGAPSVAADAEMCAMLADALEAVGIARGDYVVRINNRKVLSGVLEAAGLLDPADPQAQAGERGIVLRAIDKLDRLGEAGVRALLGAGRRDESGDFTEGAQLAPQQAETVMAFVSAYGDVQRRLDEHSTESHGLAVDVFTEAARAGASKPVDPTGNEEDALEQETWNEVALERLSEVVGDSDTGRQGIQELREIADLLRAQGYLADRIRIDPSVVRGLAYYTGPVFEAELTFEIAGEDGKPRQFGSVAGGGRYDDLVRRFTGQTVPATGVSLGVDRLLAALAARRRDASQAEGPVVVTVMDRTRMADYQAMAAELRAAGIRAEVYLGNPKNFGNQMKYADRRGAPVAVIAGEDEAARDVVQLKDLKLGAELAATASLDEWKSQPAQREVPRAALVAEIRAMLERAGR